MDEMDPVVLVWDLITLHWKWNMISGGAPALFQGTNPSLREDRSKDYQPQHAKMIDTGGGLPDPEPTTTGTSNAEELGSGSTDDEAASKKPASRAPPHVAGIQKAHPCGLGTHLPHAYILLPCRCAHAHGQSCSRRTIASLSFANYCESLVEKRSGQVTALPIWDDRLR